MCCAVFVIGRAFTLNHSNSQEHAHCETIACDAVAWPFPSYLPQALTLNTAAVFCLAALPSHPALPDLHQGGEQARRAHGCACKVHDAGPTQEQVHQEHGQHSMDPGVCVINDSIIRGCESCSCCVGQDRLNSHLFQSNINATVKESAGISSQSQPTVTDAQMPVGSVAGVHSAGC